MTGAHVYIYIYISLGLQAMLETLIIDAKMFENYGLEGVSGALGSGLACLVGDFGARTSPKEPRLEI